MSEPLGGGLASGTLAAVTTALLVGAAGFAGVMARYGLSYPFHGAALLWTTVAINVAGSLALGALVGSHGAGEQLRTIAGVGFLGGFTTFSTFTVQAFLDIEAGETGRAAAYLALSVALGLLAAAAGWYLGRTAF